MGTVHLNTHTSPVGFYLLSATYHQKVIVHRLNCFLLTYKIWTCCDFSMFTHYQLQFSKQQSQFCAYSASKPWYFIFLQKFTLDCFRPKRQRKETSSTERDQEVLRNKSESLTGLLTAFINKCKLVAVINDKRSST